MPTHRIVYRYIRFCKEVFGKSMVYKGKTGIGQHTKMCNQITIAGTLNDVCEGLIYGLKAGLDLNTMLQCITKSAAGCWSLDVLAPKIVKGDWSPGLSAVGVAGKIPLEINKALQQYFDVLLPIGNQPSDLSSAF